MIRFCQPWYGVLVMAILAVCVVPVNIPPLHVMTGSPILL